MNFKNWDIKKEISRDTWALFLDRDGVINRRLVDDYVMSWEEFSFLPGVLDAMALFARKFKYIFIVTNQQGIGKGLMSEKDLQNIHDRMIAAIEAAGGRVDAVYFCPALAKDKHSCRKPSTGMALQAKKDFPEIEFGKSIMAGDSVSDMQFGRNAGMHCVFIGNAKPNLDADAVFSSLKEFAEAI